MDKAKLYLVTIIVQRRLAQRVLNAILKAGATGATYFAAQGTGVRQTLGYAGQMIETEKQVILAVTNEPYADIVLAAAAEAGELSKPGYGIAYAQEVAKAVGFVEPPTQPATS